MARSGYLAGQIDFFNLTDAEQTLLRFGLDEVEARTQRELSLAELSLIVQGMPPSGAASAGRLPGTATAGRSWAQAAEGCFPATRLHPGRPREECEQKRSQITFHTNPIQEYEL